jgi:hypothetical protein
MYATISVPNPTTFRLQFQFLKKVPAGLSGSSVLWCDISGLFSAFDQQQLGRTGRILLVKGSGIIVNAPNVTPDLRLMSEEFTAVRDALGTPEGRQAGYVTVGMRNGERIVGFADTGLKRSQPNLDWLILVSQSEREALGPVRTTGRKSWRIWKCWRLGGHRQGKQRQPEE